MPVSILAAGGASATLHRAGGKRIRARPTGPLLSGDRWSVGAAEAGAYGPGGPPPGLVLRADSGAAWSIGPMSAGSVRYFRLTWSGEPKSPSGHQMLLPSPFDGWVSVVQSYLPSVMKAVGDDLARQGQEWMGPFWSKLPDGQVDIVPVCVQLDEGALVGSFGGVGGSPVLHRMRLPGAWYESCGSVHYAGVSRPEPGPEAWRCVTVYCAGGSITVDLDGGHGPVRLGDAGCASAPAGVRYSVRVDGATTPPEMLDGIPDETRATIGSRALGWVPLAGGQTFAAAPVAPAEGLIRLTGEDGKTLDPVHLYPAEAGANTRRWLGSDAEIIPRLIGLRVAGGVAENENTALDGLARDQGNPTVIVPPAAWLWDVAPGDPVQLFGLVPVPAISGGGSQADEG